LTLNGFPTSFSGSAKHAHRPPLIQPMSSLLWSHDRTFEEGLPHRDPTTPMFGSLHPPQDLPIHSPASKQPIHERVFPETSIRVFRGGKPPLENGNTGIHLRNHSGSSLIRLLPVSAPWLKASFTRRLPSVCSEEESPYSRMITRASASGRSFKLIPDWATAQRKAHPQSGNRHPYCSSPVGNCHPEGSPHWQLSWLIPKQATTIQKVHP